MSSCRSRLRCFSANTRSCLAGALAVMVWAPVAVASPVAGGADSTAMGGVTRASLRSSASVLTDPAVLALTPRYELQASGGLGPDSLLGLKAYALDSSTGPIALGIGYEYDHSVPATSNSDLPGWLAVDDDLSNESVKTVFGGGLGTSFGDRRLGLGLGFSWLNSATRFGGDTSWFQGNVSVAGRIGPDEALVVALVADNLLSPANTETPLTFGGGATWRPIEQVALATQVDVVTGTFDGPPQVGFGLGLEGLIAESVALRGGFKRDLDRLSDLATMGIGVYSDQMSLDYAAELVVGHAGQIPPGWDDGKLRQQHTLSLTLKL
ncbi:MAG: hypothetical protein GXP62_03480 [Oligoflexia bacterium]|nr:hypothetical protein [Oligoflexia bacterium]